MKKSVIYFSILIYIFINSSLLFANSFSDSLEGEYSNEEKMLPYGLSSEKDFVDYSIQAFGINNLSRLVNEGTDLSSDDGGYTGSGYIILNGNRYSCDIMVIKKANEITIQFAFSHEKGFYIINFETTLDESYLFGEISLSFFRNYTYYGTFGFRKK